MGGGQTAKKENNQKSGELLKKKNGSGKKVETGVHTLMREGEDRRGRSHRVEEEKKGGEKFWLQQWKRKGENSRLGVEKGKTRLWGRRKGLLGVHFESHKKASDAGEGNTDQRKPHLGGASGVPEGTSSCRRRRKSMPVGKRKGRFSTRRGEGEAGLSPRS